MQRQRQVQGSFPFGYAQGQDDDLNLEGMIDAVRFVYTDIQWVVAGWFAGGVKEVSAD